MWGNESPHTPHLGGVIQIKYRPEFFYRFKIKTNMGQGNPVPLWGFQRGKAPLAAGGSWSQAFDLQDACFTIVQGSRLPDWESITVREALPFLVPLEEARNDKPEVRAIFKGFTMTPVKTGYSAGVRNGRTTVMELLIVGDGLG